MMEGGAMLCETTVLAEMTAYAERIARAEHDLFVMEVLQATRRSLPPRVRMGAALVQIGTRMMAPSWPAALPWRTAQASR
jgi:hypothetical protein